MLEWRFRAYSLELVVGAEHIHDLVHVHLLHVFTSRLEVLARVEVFRMFVEILTDSGSHGETAVRVDVDLANSGLGSFAELFFRNTDGIRELATVGVDGVNFVLRDRRRTVENDREARELLFDGVEHVEFRWRGARRMPEEAERACQSSGRECTVPA